LIPFTIEAEDAEGRTGRQVYDPLVCEQIFLNPAPPRTFAVVSGALPDGLMPDPVTGVLTGTPTAAGTFDFTVEVTGDSGCVATFDYTIVIAAHTRIFCDDYGRS